MVEAQQQGPTLRAQWLGQQLRELREATGRKLADAAEYIQRSPATLSRFEIADYPIRRGDLLALMDLYGVSDQRHREALIKLAEEVWRKGWWNGYADQMPGSVMDYTWLEDRAQAIRSLDLLAIPGILQTREYARALIAAMEPDVSTQQQESWVDFRANRQQVLVQNEPPYLSVVLDEALVRRKIGGGAVQREQLQHLLTMGKRAHIDIRLLPFDAGAHTGHEGAFTIVEMPEPYPNVVYVETPAGGIYVEAPHTDRFQRRYDTLQSLTLEPDESAELISAVAEDLQ